MANIIKIKNLITNRTRLYQLPSEVSVTENTLCVMESRNGAKSYGIAACDSYEMDADTIKSIRTALDLDPDGEFMKVLELYGVPTAMTYPESESESESESEQVAEEAEEEDESEDHTTSCTAGDYSPSSPWNAPGMSVGDFI